MPKVEVVPGLEIEVREDGVVEASSMPEPLRKLFQAEFDRAYGKGSAKAAEEAKKQLETEVAKVREEAKKNSGDPVLAEKAKNLEIELSKLKEAEAESKKDFAEAQRLRDERHANELKDRDTLVTKAQQEVERRTGRIRELVTSEIRIAAQLHGARKESLGELDTLLGKRVDLNDNLEAFVVEVDANGNLVKGADGKNKPAVDKDGKPISIDGLVQQYLTDYPHHKAASGGRGGGASGGRSLAGDKGGKSDEWSGAVDQVAQDPSLTNVSRAVGQMLKLTGTGA
jgi:hypothetical protein